MNFNKVILAGNLTRETELRYTPKGTVVAKIALAINRIFRSESGETKKEVTFVDADAFGRTAENISQYFRKEKTRKWRSGARRFMRIGGQRRRCRMSAVHTL